MASNIISVISTTVKMQQVQRKIEESGEALSNEHQEEIMTHGLNAVWTLGKLEAPLLPLLPPFQSLLFSSFCYI